MVRKEQIQEKLKRKYLEECILFQISSQITESKTQIYWEGECIFNGRVKRTSQEIQNMDLIFKINYFRRKIK